MKRIISVLLVVLMEFSLIGCGYKKFDKKDAKIAELESRLVELENRLAEEDYVTEQFIEETTEQITTETTEVTTAEGIGTRKNPASFDEKIEATAKTHKGDIEYAITLSNLVRGADAEALAIENNQFNEWSEDEEPIIFTATFELLKYNPDDDEPYYVDKIGSFNFFTSSFGEYWSDNVISLNNGFIGEVYEGGTISGYAGGIIPKGDQSYIVFEDNVWFQLPEQ